MKAIKLFFVAMSVSFAMNANAQFANQKAGGGSYGTTPSTSDSRIHGVFDFRVGSYSYFKSGGFGFTLGIQKGIYQYKGFDLAWDIAQFEFSAPFNSPSKGDLLSLKTGARCFSPSFVNDKLRLYTNISMGWVCNLVKEFEMTEHGFGLTWGIGAQYNKKFSIGYSLMYNTTLKNTILDEFEKLSHFATIGYTF